jgi:thimet oligopeptidase
MKEMTEKYEPFPFLEGSHYQCSFLHLNSHSASVYTYLWSQVIAKDMFSKFDRSNLLDPEPMTAYRTKVLELAGSRPAEESIIDFLGRPFNTKAWEDWLNDQDEH